MKLAFLPPFVALAISASTLWGDFVFDDILLIQKGVELREFNLRRIFWDTYWGKDRVDVNYRPVVLLSYALNHRLGSGPAGFHLVNIVLDASVALMAFLVLRELTKDALLAALGASLYAALPIRTEAVANIVGRAELLAALAVLGAIFLALRNPRDRSWRPALAAGVLVFLGTAAKESAALAAPLIFAVFFITKRPLPWKTLATTLAAAAIYILLRLPVVSDNAAMVAAKQASMTTFVDNPLAYASAGERILNALRLLGLYAAKTIAPLRLSADYSFDQLPVLPAASIELWIGILAFLAPLALGLRLFWKRERLAALGLVFFPLSFAVTANVVLAIGTIFGERLAYLPSFGYALLLTGVGGLAVSRFPRHRSIVYGAFALLIVPYGWRSFERHLDWRDQATLFASTAIASPRSTRAQMLGAEAEQLRAQRLPAAARAPHYARAHGLLDRALEIYPENGRAHARRGDILFREAETAAALGDRERALKLFAAAEEAMTTALEVLRRNTQFEPLCLYFRGWARLHQGKAAEAHEDFDFYIEHQRSRSVPLDGTVLNFRGLAKGLLAAAAGAKGDAAAAGALLRQALADFDAAVERRKDLAELFNNRGNCRRLLGDLRGAAEDFRRGLELCEKAGVYFDRTRECAWLFHERLQSVYTELGDEAAAAREAKRMAEILADQETSRSGAPPR